MTERTIRWTRRAVRRLDQIGAYIANNDPAAANQVVVRLVAAAGALGSHPAMGRPGRLGGTRECVVTALPYIIVYRVTPDTIDILTVMHTARRWPDTL